MAKGEVTRRLTTIVAADVAGFSRLMGADEEGTLDALRAHRSQLIDPKIAEHGGRIANTAGDSLLIEFSSVVEALRCAAGVQRGMRQRNAEIADDRRIEFRIGINVGDVLSQGEDLLGDGVNVAARLEELARPGEVWISGTAYDQVKSKTDFDLEALGKLELKNISEPVMAYRVRPDDEGIVLPELRTVGEDLPLPQVPSIVILPFKNLSGDPKQDHLAEGFRLDIQAALIKVPELFLIATGTANNYRTSNVDAEQAGREMGVRFVLEGGIRKSGESIRLNVELTDSIARQVIWAERYDRTLDDVLTVSDEVAIELIDAVGLKLVIGEESRVFQNTLKSFEVKELLYQGLNLAWSMTKDGNAAARNLFEEVARLQPDSPVGPTQIAYSHWMDVFVGWSDAKDESLRQAMEWAQKALKFEVTNGLAHVVVAYDHLMNRHHDDALATSYLSVERRPNCPAANGFLANVLLYSGQPADSVETIKKALRLSPIYPPWFINVLAAAYRDNGDIERSILTAKKSIDLNPGNIDARMILCAAYMRGDRPDQAKMLAREVISIDPNFSIAGYIGNLPYRDRDTLSRLSLNLREAGLPD
ncbi:MAG: adenylate/guanylate cyclase domain-containing protein [Alphaproteobacteria bacterium]